MLRNTTRRKFDGAFVADEALAVSSHTQPCTSQLQTTPCPNRRFVLDSRLSPPATGTECLSYPWTTSESDPLSLPGRHLSVGMEAGATVPRSLDTNRVLTSGKLLPAVSKTIVYVSSSEILDQNKTSEAQTSFRSLLCQQCPQARLAHCLRRDSPGKEKTTTSHRFLH